MSPEESEHIRSITDRVVHMRRMLSHMEAQLREIGESEEQETAEAEQDDGDKRS